MSDHFSVSSRHELLTTWTLEDWLDAHFLLDAFEEAQKKA